MKLCEIAGYEKFPIKGYIFRLSSQSKSSLKRKFEEIVEVFFSFSKIFYFESFVNVELGYSPDLPIWDCEDKRQALVLVAEVKKNEPMFIGGLVIIDRVSRVKLLPEQKVIFLNEN